MIVPDCNLLLHAYNPASPHQAKAAGWWEQCLQGATPVGIPWVAILAFLRISTHKSFPARVAMLEAAEAVRSWLRQPNVKILSPGFRHAEIFLDLLAAVDATSGITTDAHLAALCIEYDAELHSTDGDFSRFAGLRWINPIEPTETALPKSTAGTR